MLIRIIVTYILNIFDLCMTLHYTKKFGLEVESNPFGRWLLSEPYRILIYKILVVGLLLFILWISRENKISAISSWIVLGVYTVLAVYHIILFIIIRR